MNGLIGVCCRYPGKISAGKMTVIMERDQENGAWTSVLRVSLIDEKEEKMPIREVTWAFRDLNGDEDIMVGVYGAKPTTDERDELLVSFEGLELEYRA
jgi:hypothetical protein